MMPFRTRFLAGAPIGNFIPEGALVAGTGAGCGDSATGLGCAVVVMLLRTAGDLLGCREERNSCGWKMNRTHAARPKTRISVITIRYQRLLEVRLAWGAGVAAGAEEGACVKVCAGCAAGDCQVFCPTEIRSSVTVTVFSLRLLRLVCVFFKASLMMLILKQPPPRIAARWCHRWCVFRR